MTPEFFALSPGVPGWLPWLQGAYTPKYIEVLDGRLDLVLLLRNGKERDFTLDREQCAGGSVGGSGTSSSNGARGVEYEPIDACRAEFPVAALENWRIAAPSRGSVFFALAWPDSSNGKNGDRFHFLRRGFISSSSGTKQL